MRKTHVLIAVAASIFISGCSSSVSCNSSDTKALIVRTFTDDAKSQVLKDALANMQVTQVATIEIDDRTGNCTCSARLIYTGGSKLAEIDVDYQVQSIDDGADIQILYKSDQFKSFRNHVAVAIGMDRGDMTNEWLYSKL